MNGTVYAGVPARGDDVQCCQCHMRDIWDGPKRGVVPVNWMASPLLADIGTALLAYCQKAATGNDLLITGPLGRGIRLRRLLARAGAGHVHGAHRTLSAPYRTGPGLRMQPPQCGRRRMGSLRRVRRPLLPGPHAGARHHPVLGDGGFPDQARGRAGDRRLLPAGKGGGVPGRAAQARQDLGRRLTAVHRGGGQRLELDAQRCRGARRAAGGPVRDRPWRSLLRPAEPGRKPRKPGPLGGPAYAAS